MRFYLTGANNLPFFTGRWSENKQKPLITQNPCFCVRHTLTAKRRVVYIRHSGADVFTAVFPYNQIALINSNGRYYAYQLAAVSLV